jgi:ketosteroid isomerase-like protein
MGHKTPTPVCISKEHPVQDTHTPITPATLEAFSAAWNRHDLPALMGFMHADCVFESIAGAEACGTRFQGPTAVAVAFAAAWMNFPDAQWRNGRHWVAGDRGVSEWTFTGTATDGSRVEAHGVDLFTFRDGKILVKNAFRKDRPRLSA